MAIDYEFPVVESTNKSKKADNRAKITVPSPKTYTLPMQLETRLKNAGRNIKIYNRINIKIKPGDINTCLQHLVSLTTRN